MIKRLAAAIALALPLSAFALSNSFSYQGSLNDGGSPATGSPMQGRGSFTNAGCSSRCSVPEVSIASAMDPYVEPLSMWSEPGVGMSRTDWSRSPGSGCSSIRSARLGLRSRRWANRGMDPLSARTTIVALPEVGRL